MEKEKTSTGITESGLSVLADYLELTRPGLTIFSVGTALCGCYLAMTENISYHRLLVAFIGTYLTGSSAGVLNQFIERKYDELMARTSRRPLPEGRIKPISALIFGAVLSFTGIFWLIFAANVLSGIIAFMTLLVYLFVYTPLKKITPFAAVIGGLAGASPPLIGWAVADGVITLQAMSLFFILFFWQVPHFLSLSWIYREEYAVAGYRMMSVIDRTGDVVFRQIIVYCAVLIPAALMPQAVGLKGVGYFAGAAIVSTGFFFTVLFIFRKKTRDAARNVFVASLFCLSAIFLLLVAF